MILISGKGVLFVVFDHIQAPGGVVAVVGGSTVGSRMARRTHVRIVTPVFQLGLRMRRAQAVEQGVDAFGNTLRLAQFRRRKPGGGQHREREVACGGKQVLTPVRPQQRGHRTVGRGHLAGFAAGKVRRVALNRAERAARAVRALLNGAEAVAAGGRGIGDITDSQIKKQSLKQTTESRIA